MTILQGYSIAQVSGQLIPLFFFGTAIILTGMLAFKYAVYRARLEGSFAHY